MHRKLRGLFFALACISVLGTGCYRTVVRAPQTMPAGPQYEQRQWFTVGGLVALSGEAGAECGPAGLSYAESQMSGTDILINIGLAMGGSILGTAICDSEADPAAYVACVQGTATLVPFLFSTRTVKYTCAGGGGAAKLPLIPGTTTATSDQTVDTRDKNDTGAE